MSGMLAKSQVPTRSRGGLPADVQQGIVNLKNSIRAGKQKPFNNHKDKNRASGQPLPKLSDGFHYVESDVGHGREDRGERRLVAEVNTKSNQIREIYFSDEHYLKGSFVRVV